MAKKNETFMSKEQFAAHYKMMREIDPETLSIRVFRTGCGCIGAAGLGTMALQAVGGATAFTTAVSMSTIVVPGALVLGAALLGYQAGEMAADLTMDAVNLAQKHLGQIALDKGVVIVPREEATA